VAEREAEIFLKYLEDRECVFPVKDGHPPCKQFGYSCLNCIKANINQVALVSLAEEGIKIKDGKGC
jgi:hypothetical protein